MKAVKIIYISLAVMLSAANANAWDYNYSEILSKDCNMDSNKCLNAQPTLAELQAGADKEPATRPIKGIVAFASVVNPYNKQFVYNWGSGCDSSDAGDKAAGFPLGYNQTYNAGLIPDIAGASASCTKSWFPTVQMSGGGCFNGWYGFAPKQPTRKCHRYSCYYQALGMVVNSPLPIQPLTNDLVAIQVLIHKNEASGDTNQFNSGSGILTSKLNATTNVYGDPNINNLGTIPVGAGTSAIQGLIWAFRVLSPNWKGVWAQKSSYEYDLKGRDARVNLPSEDNAKHIIMISDGEDNDGPKYKSSYATVDADGQGQIFDWDAMEAAGETTAELFGTCDAHAPLESITTQNYIDVCTQMKGKAIVHAILYDYDVSKGKSPLQECAEITGGGFYKDIKPADLSNTLNTIFANIASYKIRLIDPD